MQNRAMTAPHRRSSIGLRLAATILMAAVACSSSSVQDFEPQSVAPIIAKLDRFLLAHNQCEVTSDCTLVDAQCLRGCGVAVNKAHKKATLKAVEKLNAEYSAATHSCSHWLCLPTAAQCSAQRCSVVVVREADRTADAATDAGEAQ